MPLSGEYVEDWLDRIPPAEQPTRKLTEPHRKCRRLPLADLDGIELPNATKRPRLASEKDKSLSKRPALVPDRTADWDVDADGGEEEDAHATPKASRSTPPPLEPEASDYDTNSPSRTPRSRSPTKIVQQQGTDGGLRLKVLDSIDEVSEAHPLWGIRKLLEQLEDCKDGINVMAPSIKDSALNDPRCQREFRHKSDDFFAKPGYYDTIGRAPNIDDIIRIKKRTQKCREVQEHEPGWDCSVHYPILELARECSAYSDDVHIANITTARIKPDSLLPSERSGERLRSKAVDLAIVLGPSQITSTAFRNLEGIPGSELGSKSFNQTPMNTVANKPIALSIKTKSQSGSSDEARVQLAFWLSAQFKCLELLLDETAKKAHKEKRALPVLPVLSFEGPSLRFLAATKNRPGDKEGILWDCLTIGEADSFRGACQILAASLHLIRWAQTEYRPWFEENAAPLTQEERAAVSNSYPRAIIPTH